MNIEIGRLYKHRKYNDIIRLIRIDNNRLFPYCIKRVDSQTTDHYATREGWFNSKHFNEDNYEEVSEMKVGQKWKYKDNGELCVIAKIDNTATQTIDVHYIDRNVISPYNIDFFLRNFEMVAEVMKIKDIKVGDDYYRADTDQLCKIENVGIVNKIITVRYKVSANICDYTFEYFSKIFVKTGSKLAEVADKFEKKTFDTGAVRSVDADNVRYDLITPVGLRRLAETYKEGAIKYGVDNWKKGFPISECLNHAMKHIEQYRDGDVSEDHLAHAVWNLMTIMHFEERMPEMQDITTRKK